MTKREKETKELRHSLMTLKKMDKIFGTEYPKIEKKGFGIFKEINFLADWKQEVSFYSLDEKTRKELKETIQKAVVEKAKEIEEALKNR